MYNNTLEEMIADKMMDCGEVLELKELVYEIAEFEEGKGVKHTDEEILKAWTVGANYCVDAYINNCYDSDYWNEKGDGYLTGEAKEKKMNEDIERWEALRPINVRIKYLENLTIEKGE